MGLRINFDKTTDPTERLPGSFGHTIIDSVLTCKIQDVAVAGGNMTLLASDNPSVKDFDMTVVYNVNLCCVRTVNDQKPDLSRHERQKWRNSADAKLRGTATEEKLADKITVSQVQVQVQVQVLAILPADVIVNSANELVRAQCELKTKEVEVQTAKKRSGMLCCIKRNRWCNQVQKCDG